jgi:hypothetical protein
MEQVNFEKIAGNAQKEEEDDLECFRMVVF